jgi:hypothetical protein
VRERLVQDCNVFRGQEEAARKRFLRSYDDKRISGCTRARLELVEPFRDSS